MASCPSESGSREDHTTAEVGTGPPPITHELHNSSESIHSSRPQLQGTPLIEYHGYHASGVEEGHDRALQRVLLERRALSRDMVRLQDSLMTKTQENLLLRGKLGIAQLELDRKEEITRQCIEEMRRLHAENNRLLSVVQANGLDIGGKHHQSTAAVAPISSPATTAASGEDCCAIPPSKPMSAEEEYFRMVVLAVKLNSTYLDNLGLFDPRDLYRRACEEKVPFHQWHKWVESQMIRGVYRPLAGSAPTSPQPPPQPPTAEGNDSIGPTLEGKRSVIRDEYLHGGAPNSSSSSSSFFGNRLQLPERVNGIFSSISRRVGRQSNHDTPKCHQRGGAPARRRAASLEITPRRGHQASEEDSSPGGMSRFTGKASAVMKRNSHYRKHLSTGAAAH